MKKYQQVLIILVISAGTYAWFTWNSTNNTNLTMSIGASSDVIFKNGNDISTNKVNEDDIKSIIKSFKLKRLFREEQSIVLAKEIATYDSMFGDGKLYIDEIKELEKIKVKDIFDIGMKVLNKKSVEIAEG